MSVMTPQKQKEEVDQKRIPEVDSFFKVLSQFETFEHNQFKPLKEKLEKYKQDAIKAIKNAGLQSYESIHGDKLISLKYTKEYSFSEDHSKLLKQLEEREEEIATLKKAIKDKEKAEIKSGSADLLNTKLAGAQIRSK